MQPSELLGIPASATTVEIEAAYDRHMSRWQPLLSHPTRGTEAEEMIARLDAARREMLVRLDAGEGGLRVDESVTVSRVSGPRMIDKQACPECGYRENPPDARFCISCQRVLVQQCPNPQCRSELPWHQDICHRCGTDIERFRIEQEELHEHTIQEQQALKQRNVQKLSTDLSAIEAMPWYGVLFRSEFYELAKEYEVVWMARFAIFGLFFVPMMCLMFATPVFGWSTLALILPLIVMYLRMGGGSKREIEKRIRDRLVQAQGQ